MPPLSVSDPRPRLRWDNQMFFASIRTSSQASKKPKLKRHEREKEWLGASFKPENFIPGLVIGFILGLILDMSKPFRFPTKRGSKGSFAAGKPYTLAATDSGEELKLVLVVRKDLGMGPGKIASQCAHAATGMYQELMQSHRSLLKQWEYCGQPKIVVTCKNQHEMNKLKAAAEDVGLPTYVVADAGRTQIASGSKTVLAVGPGSKAAVDAVTGKQRLL